MANSPVVTPIWPDGRTKAFGLESSKTAYSQWRLVRFAAWTMRSPTRRTRAFCAALFDTFCVRSVSAQAACDCWTSTPSSMKTS